MKKLLAVLLLLLPLLLSPALAESARVTDNADVLTADQENALETAISVIRNTYSFDVVILTEDSIGSRRTDDYSDLYYANGGFGYGENHDGIMLLLVTGGGEGNRDYYIMNTGRGEKIFTDSVMYDMEDNMLPQLRFSDYYGGVSQFVIDVQHHLEADMLACQAQQIPNADLEGGTMAGPWSFVLGMGVGGCVVICLLLLLGVV